MEYSHTDAGLLRQPVGYWSWAAYKATVGRTRAALADIGTTQPQCWILEQIARAENAPSRAEVCGVLEGYLDTGAQAVAAEIDETVARGWVAEDGEGRLRLTAEGRAFREKTAVLQGELWAERHRDISDEEYLTTLKVLQRFIHNTGGHAWHQ
ncbi:MarR family transcriptional regulator [Streptomyces sp. URMC 126]|uniref:MarR family transcriptional regulator n=1 Tax=Streptomyces sp. URMC 126 TaxID=3423401 RepID=UPI003F1CB5F4